MATVRRWVIGRAADCDLVVNQPEVSLRHCCLVQTDQGFVLEDLNSSNGTFVDGARITSKVRVRPPDRITLGQQTPMPWPSLADAPSQTVIRIGRATDNDIILDCPSVSSHHAQVVLDGDKAMIEDLGSTNGTAIGHPGRNIRQAPLSKRDIVYLGSLCLPACRLLARNLALGEKSHSTVTFRGSSMVFGRDAKCDQVLDYPMISARHARLFRSGNSLQLEDLGSTNGTFVNGRRVQGTVRIEPSDIIALGSFSFTLTANGALEKRDHRGNLTLEARGITVDVRGKRLIEDVSLTIFSSELVGLMGPSGAGKTTFITALNGYTPPTSGDVFLNGKDVYEHYEQFRSRLGYVPQDDIIHRDLTVGRALYYSARLRLPPDYSRAEIRERIKQVVKQMGLEGTECILIGSPEKKGISGGQRKRVNLAMELLTDPLVLFLDEPTSGLSSEDALMVMKVLRHLADSGKTILLTIHQPSLDVFRLMDNLIVMSKDAGSSAPGRVAYYGPAYPDAVHFFNPAGVPNAKPGIDPLPDDVLRGLARRPTDAWVERYRRSPYQRAYVTERAGTQTRAKRRIQFSGHRSWPFFQWRTLSARCLTIKLKDSINTAILMAQAPIVACLIGLVFGKPLSEPVTDQNWPQVAHSLGITLFLMTLAALWLGASNAVREIVGEWAIYHRERMLNLQLSSYVGSKLTVLGGLCVVQCGVLLGIVSWWCQLRGPCVPMYALLLLTAWVGVAIGLVLSAVAKSSEVAIALLPIVMLAMVILCGVLQPIHKMPKAVQLVCQAVPARWAFEGSLLLESNRRPTYAPPILPTAGGRAEPVERRDMAEHYFPKETHRTSVGASFAGLTVMFILFSSLILLILRTRDVH